MKSVVNDQLCKIIEEKRERIKIEILVVCLRPREQAVNNPLYEKLGLQYLFK
jgi:hypothetical protein